MYLSDLDGKIIYFDKFTYVTNVFKKLIKSFYDSYWKNYLAIDFFSVQDKNNNGQKKKKDKLSKVKPPQIN